jgi:hypothetical protein
MIKHSLAVLSLGALFLAGCNATPVTPSSYSTTIQRWPTSTTGSLQFWDYYDVQQPDGTYKSFADKVYITSIGTDGKTAWNLPDLAGLRTFDASYILQGCSVSDKTIAQKIIRIDSDKGTIIASNKAPEANANGYVANQVTLISFIYVNRDISITGDCTLRDNGTFIKSNINWKKGWNFVTVETDANAIESFGGFPVIQDAKYTMDFYHIPVSNGPIFTNPKGGLQYIVGKSPKPFLPFLKR